MNLIHRRLCSSGRWARWVRDEIVPWTLDGVDLGPDVLEVGPGFGATTRALSGRASRLTAVEVDQASARRLAAEFRGRVEVVHADATQLPFGDETYSAVVCFTMLHHVPTPDLQDRLLAEAVRVLRPGGVFAGCDSRDSVGMRASHVGDVLVVDPGTLSDRLTGAGLVDVETALTRGRVRFRGRKPGS